MLLVCSYAFVLISAHRLNTKLKKPVLLTNIPSECFFLLEYVVSRSRTIIPSHPHQLLAELSWRSLMTFICLEWQLISRCPLKSICTWVPEQLLKDLVSWVSPSVYSTIDRFLGYAIGVLFWPVSITVQQYGARLQIHTLNYWTEMSVVPGF